MKQILSRSELTYTSFDAAKVSMHDISGYAVIFDIVEANVAYSLRTQGVMAHGVRSMESWHV